MYVCMYACMHACMHACMYVNLTNSARCCKRSYHPVDNLYLSDASTMWIMYKQRA